MKKLKTKKGFTLVEIIVVLVIIAILAAATVPTMLGFVSKARESEETANARAVFLAAQAIVTERTAADSTYSTVTDSDKTEIINLSGHEDIASNADITTVDISSGKVTKVEYSTSKYTVTIEGDKTVTVTKK